MLSTKNKKIQIRCSPSLKSFHSNGEGGGVNSCSTVIIVNPGCCGNTLDWHQKSYWGFRIHFLEEVTLELSLKGHVGDSLVKKYLKPYYH